MKKISSLIILLAVCFNSFGQDIKKYILIENTDGKLSYFKLITMNDGSEKYIDIVYVTKSYLYLNEQSVMKKIKVSEIDLSRISKNYFTEEDISINQSLNNFSKQAKIGLAIQLISPAIPLILKTEIGLYSALGLSIIGATIHILAFNHLTTFAMINQAVDY
jgi:hypothetical protein